MITLVYFHVVLMEFNEAGSYFLAIFSNDIEVAILTCVLGMCCISFYLVIQHHHMQ